MMQQSLVIVFLGAYAILFVRIVLYRRAHSRRLENAMWLCILILIILQIALRNSWWHVIPKG